MWMKHWCVCSTDVTWSRWGLFYFCAGLGNWTEQFFDTDHYTICAPDWIIFKTFWTPLTSVFWVAWDLVYGFRDISWWKAFRLIKWLWYTTSLNLKASVTKTHVTVSSPSFCVSTRMFVNVRIRHSLFAMWCCWLVVVSYKCSDDNTSWWKVKSNLMVFKVLLSCFSKPIIRMSTYTLSFNLIYLHQCLNEFLQIQNDIFLKNTKLWLKKPHSSLQLILICTEAWK